MVVPFRLGLSGLAMWATSCAYSGAARLSSTISTNSPSAAIAMRFLRSCRHASAHGLRPATAGRNSVVSSCSARAAINGSPPRRAPLLRQPELVDQDVPLRIPHVAVHVGRQEVDLLGVVQIDPRRLVGELVVDGRP